MYLLGIRFYYKLLCYIKYEVGFFKVDLNGIGNVVFWGKVVDFYLVVVNNIVRV